LHQFNEHHPELKGFSAYFAKEIFPFLSAREADRKVSLKKAVFACLFISIIGLIAIVVIIAIQGVSNIIFYVGIVTVMAIGGLYRYLMRDVQSFTKQKIVDGICSYVGWQFDAQPALPILSHWSSLMLIRKGYERIERYRSNKIKLEDEISGSAHGALFKSIEVKLTRKSGKNRVTDFQGQLMSITFPRTFLGRTIVLRDKGFLQGKKKGDMKRVGLVDPVFEKIFEAYGTDQVEARYLLTPVFMQTLVDLENSVGGKNIRFGFDKNMLFIAVETKNQFEAGSMLEPLTDPACTQKILDEIAALSMISSISSISSAALIGGSEDERLSLFFDSNWRFRTILFNLKVRVNCLDVFDDDFAAS